jgi:hypothetical protein
MHANYEAGSRRTMPVRPGSVFSGAVVVILTGCLSRDLSKYPERLGRRYAHDAMDCLRSEMLSRSRSPEHHSHVRILDRELALVPSADADLQCR